MSLSGRERGEGFLAAFSVLPALEPSQRGEGFLGVLIVAAFDSSQRGE
jgi:hypothetical protein